MAQEAETSGSLLNFFETNELVVPTNWEVLNGTFIEEAEASGMSTGWGYKLKHYSVHNNLLHGSIPSEIGLFTGEYHLD